MTFLQPLLLWGLALAAIPILIHLLNRLRYRTVKWGAMMFLLRVTRSSSRRSRLRHYLILAARTLALAALAIALARPLAGGWLGAAWGRSPDAVLLLLDRSASMERRDPSGRSLRETALQRLAEVPAERLRGSRFVFIDSVFQSPREIAGPGAVQALAWSEASDTAADWPALTEAALDWIDRHQPGRTELWMLSDVQESNWRPASAAWRTLNTRLAERRPSVRARALILQGSGGDSVALRHRGVQRHPEGGYELAYSLAAGQPRSEPLPAALITPGARTLLPLALPAAQSEGALRLPGGGTLGWAGIELPADAHPGDNAAWYVFGPAPEGAVWSHADDPAMRSRIRNAFRPLRASDPHPVRDWPSDAPPPLDDAALVVWQGEPPGGTHAAALASYLQAGGVALALPPLEAASTTVPAADVLWRWTDPTDAPAGHPWRIAQWDHQTGPLAHSIEGSPLPIGEASILRRSRFASSLEPVYAEARLDDGEAALLRVPHGAGRLYALTTLPLPGASELGDGRIWVPAVWRLREEGAHRLGDALNAECGIWQPASPDEPWEAVEADLPRDPRAHAGIYRLGSRLLALNRPEAEDDTSFLDAAALRALLPDVRFDVSLASSDRDGEASDLTLAFLLLAALFFLAEAALALSLHPRAEASRTAPGGTP